MNYTRENLRNALAAEYVLGTLRGLARQRFQKLILSNQTIAETVSLWEQYINGMGEKIPPVEPDDKVWQVIQSRIDYKSEQSNVVEMPVKKPSKSPWKVIAMAASLLIAVAVTTFTVKQLEPTVSQVAVVVDEDSKPLWVIEYSDKDLIIRPTDKVELLAQNDYQLWIVPATGEPPVSLGILPQREQVIAKAPDSLSDLPFTILAVSLEPLGGSPTGQPTQVLFTAEVTSV